MGRGREAGGDRSLGIMEIIVSPEAPALVWSPASSDSEREFGFQRPLSVALPLKRVESCITQRKESDGSRQLQVK